MREDSFHLGIKAIIKNKQGKILLLKVNRAKLKNYKSKAYWDIPGGRIHKKSSIEETLKREVKEETGIKDIKSFKPFSMVLSNIRIPISKNKDVGLILASYICEVENIKNIRISDEHTEYKWFNPSKASELLKVKYPKEFIEKLSKLK